MVLQPVLSTKPLLVTVTSPPNSTTSSDNPMHSFNQVTSHNHTNTFLNLVRDTNSAEMNLLTSLYHPPKPEPTQQQSPSQPLYRALMQQFGGVPVDPSSLPHLLSALSKRAAPVSIGARPTPVPATNAPIDPVVPSVSSPSNFAMTAAITSALSSNASVVGPQLLPACSPLLQLAIRQALGQCLPHFTQLTIQGNLEISVGSGAGQLAHSMTVLKFNDNGSTQACLDSTADKSYTNGFYDGGNLMMTTAPNTMTTTSNGFASSGAATMTTPSNTEVVTSPEQTPTNGQFGTSSSRRKSTNPIKCTVAEMVDSLSGSTSLSPTNTTTSPLMIGRSGPTSPSTDSGVLDLSRNGSLAGSAPITPLKDLSLTHGAGKSEAIDTGRHQLLEAYQKQLTAFSQYHSVWNRAVLGSVEQRSNGDHQSTSPASTLFPTSSNGALSAPNSPAKPVRRQRVSAGGGSNSSNAAVSSSRMCPVRRPSSNRRFPCNQCREEFPSLHTLEEHTMFQHGTYRCHICNAQFTQRSNLQRHALKHVGFKPFECRVCSKAYYRKDHLMRHMEMGHPGYTPRENITVHLTSSESLDYLNRSTQQGLLPTSSASTTVTNGTLHPSPSDPEDHGIGMEIDDEACRIDVDVEEEEDGVDCNLALHTSSPPNGSSEHGLGSPGGEGSPHAYESFEDEVDGRQANDHSTSEDDQTAALSPEPTEDVAPSQFDSHSLASPPTFTPYAAGKESQKMTV